MLGRRTPVRPQTKTITWSGLHNARGDWGHLMLRERIGPQSEVTRAIILEDSPCCGVPHLPASGFGQCASIFCLSTQPAAPAPAVSTAPFEKRLLLKNGSF